MASVQEVQRLRAEIDRLTAELNSIRREFLVNHDKLAKSEEELTTRTRRFQTFILNLVDRLESLESTGSLDFSGYVEDVDLLSMVNDDVDAAGLTRRLGRLLGDCMKFAASARELEQETAAGSQFESAARRDGEKLFRKLSDTVDHLQSNVTELDEKLAASTKEQQTLFAKLRHCDVRSESDRSERGDERNDRSEKSVTSDLLESLRLENEELRRLVEVSTAPHMLSTDYEEQLMAEVEALKAECATLRLQLQVSQGRRRNSEEDDVDTGPRSKSETSAAIATATAKTILQPDDAKLLVELQSAVDLERETSDRLRRRVNRLTEDIKARADECLELQKTVNEVRRLNGELRTQNRRLADEAAVARWQEELRTKKTTMRKSLEMVTVETQTEVENYDEDGGANEANENSSRSVASSLRSSEVNSAARRQAADDDDDDQISGLPPPTISDYENVDDIWNPSAIGDGSNKIDDMAGLIRRYGQLIAENRSLREKTAIAWKVSVQHAVSHSIAVQTPASLLKISSNDDDDDDDGARCGGRRRHEQQLRRRVRLERELCRQLARSRSLTAELFYLQCRAIDCHLATAANSSRPSTSASGVRHPGHGGQEGTEDDVGEELSRRLLRDVTVDSLRLVRSSARFGESLSAYTMCHSSEDEDEEREEGKGTDGGHDGPLTDVKENDRTGSRITTSSQRMNKIHYSDGDVDDLVQLVRKENDRMTERISTLRQSVESNQPVHFTATTPHNNNNNNNNRSHLTSSGMDDLPAVGCHVTNGDCFRQLDTSSSSQLLAEVCRLQKLLVENETRGRHIIHTYRRHLLSSVQGRMDPTVKDSLLRILESKTSSPVTNTTTNEANYRSGGVSSRRSNIIGSSAHHHYS
jgi:uncharacterized protein YoxC